MREKINSLPHLTRSLVAAACALACLGAHAAAVVVQPAGATIIVTSRDEPGIGFNDPTVVAPVGGNMGITLGAQRMNVYRHVADIWQRNLQSNVTITISAAWDPTMFCNANQATLGSAGALNIWNDVPNGKPNTWYPGALANKLAGVNLTDGTPDDGTGYSNYDIITQFNPNLGKPDCLAGSPFYLGLDGNAGAKINFVETLLHEIGHGLGFSVLSVQTSTGKRINADFTAYTDDGLPSIWESYMYDNTANKTWLAMTSAERMASAVRPLNLAWTGPSAVAGASMLAVMPWLKVASPAPGTAGLYQYNPSQFGPAFTNPSPLGTMALLTAQAGEAGPACSPFNAANRAAVAGKVPIISRGGCTFTIKVKNAQDAGAIGVIIANNAAGAIAPAGADPTITIPSAGVLMVDGNAMKNAVTAAIPYGSRSKPGAAVASFFKDPTKIAGADSKGRPLLYTPSTLAPGSSVSHWDVSASPNLLMEPNINADLGTIVVAPQDLTLNLLKDIGW